MLEYITLILLFIFFLFIFNKSKIFKNYFIDNEFKKVQSFHDNPTPIIGGCLFFLSLFFYFIFFNINFLNLKILILIGLINFLVGLADDLKFIRSPTIRFFLIIFFNLLIIINYDLSIKNFEVLFLDYLNQITFLNYILILLALFFIINGANLIDGFNGLLGIHSLVILLILRYILEVQTYDYFEIKKYVNILIILNSCFLYFNFPNAKIFLGDSGAYFLGSQLALLSIIIYNFFDNISPFFISILLSYLFFEIFFSVLRKLYEKKNPFLPDGFHMHMLIYKYFKSKKLKANPFTGFFVNLFYLLLILPSLLYFDNNMLCMTHFFIIIFTYLGIYFLLRRRVG